MEDIYNIKGVGCVVSGFVNCGEYKKGEPLFVGPMKDGSYVKAVVRSIHVARTTVDHTYAGHSACFALSSVTKNERTSLARGMVALSALPDPATVRTFTAEIVMLNGMNVTCVKGRYNATAHILHLRKAVKVVDIAHNTNKLGQMRDEASSVLRPGDQAKVTFKFVTNTAYVRAGMRLILRDGHVRAIGVITGTS